MAFQAFMNCHIDLVDKRNNDAFEDRNNDAFEDRVIVLEGWTFKRVLQRRNKIEDAFGLYLMRTKSDL